MNYALPGQPGQPMQHPQQGQYQPQQMQAPPQGQYPQPGAVPGPQPGAYPGPQPAQPQYPPQQTMQPQYPQQGQYPPQQAMQPQYPQQMQAPPQGYPPQQTMQPQYPQQGQYPPQQGQPQQAAFGAVDPFLASQIASAVGGQREPEPGDGAYAFEIVESGVTGRTRTFIAKLKILESTNPSFQPGAIVAYVEGSEFGGGRIRAFVLVANGWSSTDQFDQACAQQGQNGAQASIPLISGAMQGTQSSLVGRRVAAIVTTTNKIAGPKSKTPGKEQTFKNWQWSPRQ